MIACHHDTRAQKADKGVSGAKLDIDQMARQDRHLFEVQEFYDQMDFNSYQWLTVTKAIIELSDLSRSSDLTKKSLYEDDNCFDKEVKHISSEYHNRPSSSLLPCTERGLVDLSSSLNIIPLLTLGVVGLPSKHIVEQLIKYLVLEKNTYLTLNDVNFHIVDFVVGPIGAATQFHIIDAHTSDHLLLGNPWNYKHYCMPCIYHQCLKALWRGRRCTLRFLKHHSRKVKHDS